MMDKACAIKYEQSTSTSNIVPEILVLKYAMPFLNCLPKRPLEAHINPPWNSHETEAEGRSGALTIQASLETTASRLLALPKELRLQIWEHVLTDPSAERLRVCISRRGCDGPCKQITTSISKSTNKPEIKTFLESCRDTNIDLRLLRANRLIYSEALPILYNNVVFCLYDFQGILPLFLQSLSSFAVANIRYISLDPGRIIGATGFFSWAITCAQVATLSGSLRLVEVLNARILITLDASHRRALILPLLKIRTPKEYHSEKSTALERLLEEITEEWNAKRTLQKISGNTAGTEQQHNRSITPENEEPANENHVTGLASLNEATDPYLFTALDERKIAQDLSTVPGIADFELELSRWNMITVPGTSPPYEANLTSAPEDDQWTEAASTIVGKEEEDEDALEDDWELVKKLATT